MGIPNQQHVLKDILSLLMDECDIDDAQLAKHTGVPASTISRMRTNSNANPTASSLRPVAKFFSISISQLLGDEPLPKDRIPGTYIPTSFTSARIPIIEWPWILDWIQNGCERIKEQLQTWISTEKEVGNKAFALTIPTGTLGLAFRKGSTIILDPSQNPIDGDLILVNLKDGTILLKQILIDGNEKYLRSINPEIKNIITLSEEQKIISTVIETRFSLQTVQKTATQKEKDLQFSLTNTPEFQLS